MSQLSDLQIPLDQQVHRTVLEIIPDSWTRARLEASVEPGTPGTASIAMRFDGLGQPGIAFVSDELQEQVRRLFRLHERFGTGLRRIVYSYEQPPEGRWRFKADYEYTSH